MGHRNGGRKPKPVELRRLDGDVPGTRSTVSHRRIPEPVVVRGVQPPQKPRGMPRDAQRAWEAIVPPLAGIGLLDAIDEVALEAMCTAYARAKEAGRIVDRDGHFTTGSAGQIVEHPAVGIERASVALFLRYAEQYGLTPSARTRLGLTELKRRAVSEEMAARIGPSPRSAS
jgi:P27 family predicted phage terminase small subunit